MTLVKFNIISVQSTRPWTRLKNDKVLSLFMKGGIMWSILHFPGLICHVVGGSDRSLYEVLDYNGNKLRCGAKV